MCSVFIFFVICDTFVDISVLSAGNFFLFFMQVCNGNEIYLFRIFSFYLEIFAIFFLHEMGLCMTKPVFGVSDTVRLKPVCSATETS